MKISKKRLQQILQEELARVNEEELNLSTLEPKVKEILSKLSPSLKSFTKAKAHEWASKQTWTERSYTWKHLFTRLLNSELTKDNYEKTRLREEQEMQNN